MTNTFPALTIDSLAAYAIATYADDAPDLDSLLAEINDDADACAAIFLAPDANTAEIIAFFDTAAELIHSDEFAAMIATAFARRTSIDDI